MEYKFYSTFCFLNDKTELSKDDLDIQKIYYRFYLEETISSIVGERYINGKFDQIFYRGGNLQDIEKYHLKKFSYSPQFNIIQVLSEYTILLKNYENGNFEGAELYIYNSNYEQVESLIFNGEFLLQEYAQKGRKFLAYNWTILERF